MAGEILVPTDQDLIIRLTDVEDSFTERKAKGDRGEWVQAAVAFANSVPVGYPAVLFLGVNDDGTIAENVNVETTMKQFSDLMLSRAYPVIYFLSHVLTHNGRSCVAVIVPGSELRPHFAGKAYVRDGTQTRDASHEQFVKLIAESNSKARYLIPHRSKQITLYTSKMKGTHNYNRSRSFWILEACNQFFVTLRMASKDSNYRRSIPLSMLEISHDCDQNQPSIEIEE